MLQLSEIPAKTFRAERTKFPNSAKRTPIIRHRNAAADPTETFRRIINHQVALRARARISRIRRVPGARPGTSSITARSATDSAR